MAIIGVARDWHDDEGWGVVDSDETPGGCWTHFSALAVAGYRSLTPGARVHLDWEPVIDQDGFRFRALRAWPVGADPVDDPPPPPGEAYRSRLTITFDKDPDAHH